MISVLIPVYNYDVTSLVGAIHRQMSSSNIDFEIICLEDGSRDKSITLNSSINSYTHTRQMVSAQNLGRIKIRKRLLKEARYDWLLFLDADVLPKSGRFIENYIYSISNNVLAIFGGICYEEKIPEPDSRLRWKYGKRYEQTKAAKRNKNPYKQIVSANMMMQRSVLESINFDDTSDGYGMDENYLSVHLRDNDIKFIHIDNEVYHLGIDKNNIFLNKTREAVENLLHLYTENKITIEHYTLLNYFTFLKKWGLSSVMGKIFRIFRNRMEENLKSEDPSINLFQFYKLGYICSKDQNL